MKAGPVVRRGIAEAEPLAVYRSAAAAKGANGVGVRTLLDLAMNWYRNYSPSRC